MSKARKTLPKGIAPVGEQNRLDNVVFVNWIERDRQVVERPVSMVIFVDFTTKQKIGHVVHVMDGRATA